MADLVKFTAFVTNMQVKVKQFRTMNEAGDFVNIAKRIGRLTLEFDGDSINVAALTELIHGHAVYIGLEDTQSRLM